MALFRREPKVIRRVLVVEDEALVAFDNEHQLSLAGYTVVATVDRGELALACLDAAAAGDGAVDGVDAVVLDVGLAGDISGIAVARHAAGMGIPVLFVTGQCPAGGRELAYGCLAKPYTPAALVAALEIADAIARQAPVETLPPGFTLFHPADA